MACIVIAALIALTSITFGVKAIREAVIDFFVETFEKFSIVGFKDEDILENNKTIETYYAPTYIPEGYSLVSDEKLEMYRAMKYVMKDSCLYFKQNTLRSISTYIDTEKANTVKVQVGTNTAFYMLKDKLSILYWNDNNYSYTILSENGLVMQEIVRIVESIKAE